MKIRQAESLLLKVPLDPPIADSINYVQYIGLPIIGITTEDGVVGTGFNWTIGGGAEFVKEVLDRYLIPRLVGQDSEYRKKLISELSYVENFGWDYRLGKTGLSQMALAAIDMALWDIECKKAGKPLWQILGATRDKVEAYNTHGGWLSWSIEELISNAKKLVKEGYRSVKIKVGSPDPARDYERLKALRAALGNNVNIMIDANTKWDLETALRWGRKFEDFNIYWFEEPLSPLDVKGHSILAQELDVPIAVGESLYSKYSFATYIENKACDILQPDSTKVTGITEWLEVANIALGEGLNVYPHTCIQQPVHVQLVAAVPNGIFVEHVPWLLNVWKHPVEPKNGFFSLPQTPGIGTDLRQDAVEKFSVDIHTALPTN